MRGSHAVLEPPNSLCVFIMDEQEGRTRVGCIWFILFENRATLNRNLPPDYIYSIFLI